MILEDGSVRKRRKSYDLPGHVHFLTFSCYRRLPLLDNDPTRRLLVESLDRSRLRHDCALIGYVIMPEHVHLLIFPRHPVTPIAAILQSIKQPVARRVIDRLRRECSPQLQQITKDDAKRSCCFWQPGGGFDRNITSQGTLRKTLDYIHHNPVRRGLVGSPIGWPWSSARHYARSGDAVLTMDAAPR